MIHSLKILLMLLCAIGVGILMLREGMALCEAVHIPPLYGFFVFPALLGAVLWRECWGTK